jgi:hypothetical protein
LHGLGNVEDDYYFDNDDTIRLDQEELSAAIVVAIESSEFTGSVKCKR